MKFIRSIISFLRFPACFPVTFMRMCPNLPNPAVEHYESVKTASGAGVQRSGQFDRLVTQLVLSWHVKHQHVNQGICRNACHRLFRRSFRWSSQFPFSLFSCNVTQKKKRWTMRNLRRRYLIQSVQKPAETFLSWSWRNFNLSINPSIRPNSSRLWMESHKRLCSAVMNLSTPETLVKDAVGACDASA